MQGRLIARDKLDGKLRLPPTKTLKIASINTAHCQSAPFWNAAFNHCYVTQLITSESNIDVLLNKTIKWEDARFRKLMFSSGI